MYDSIWLNMDFKELSEADTPNRDRDPVTTVQDLPAETFTELFRYLTHTEKLISRLVCPNWNHQISSFLINHSYYSLTSKRSLQVVLDSHDAGMEWTKIKISDHDFILPSKFKNSVTTLEVHMPKFRSKSTEYITFLAQFSCLTNLKVILDGGGSDDKAIVETDAQALVLNRYFKTIFEKLRSLAITFPFNGYSALSDFLSRIPACAWLQCSNLDVLHITEKGPSFDIERLADKYDVGRRAVRSELRKLISRNSHTLKSLTLDFNSETIQKEIFQTIIPYFNKNTKFLKLESVLISRGPSQKYIERDFSTLQEFLKKQASLRKLKNVILPWCPDVSLCQEFVRCLTPDIEFVGNLRDEHITEEFPATFKKLNSVSIESDLNLARQTFITKYDNVRRLEIDLRKSRNVQPLTLYDVLSDKCDYLSDIKLIGNGVSVFDSDLREIIQQMCCLRYLRVLHLESCKITDFGVLGVREDDVELQELINTKRLYYPQIHYEELLMKVTQPLSYLEDLEKLVLVGTNITDVGIILGLNFGLKLKQLILTSESPEVTDFGLYSLGSNNPGLEAFQGSFKSEKISTVGIEKLKKQLPLTEFTRKFKVVNVEPDN